jgi:DNA-binding GntR family transcriptional regulator
VANETPTTDELLSTALGRHGVNLADETFRRLYDLVVSHETPVTTPLREIELAARLEVSRTPLRQALQRLETFGLIERRGGRGVVVPPMSIVEMENISRARERLEGLIACSVGKRYACGEVSIDTLRTINRRVRAFRDIEDAQAMLDTGIAFHAEMRRLAANPVASQLLGQTLLRLERYRRLVHYKIDRGGDIHSEHERVLERLEAKDPEGAEKEMRRHIANARRFYRQALGSYFADTATRTKRAVAAAENVD